MLRQATDAWLRKKKWNARELHDALVALGSALPQGLSRRTYLDRLRVACADPKMMRARGDTFPVKVLKPALQSLGLGVAGSKPQLVERLCMALKDDAASSGAQGAEAESEDDEAPPADGDIEADFGRSAKAVAFAKRAAAAFEEHSGGGAQILEDEFDIFVDAEEDDVRAEQEALLQLKPGVNPSDLDTAALRPAVEVISEATCKGVLAKGPKKKNEEESVGREPVRTQFGRDGPSSAEIVTSCFTKPSEGWSPR